MIIAGLRVKVAARNWCFFRASVHVPAAQPLVAAETGRLLNSSVVKYREDRLDSILRCTLSGKWVQDIHLRFGCERQYM